MLIPSISALAMGVAFCVLFYTDYRLNQAGIASPRGFGDGIVGLVSLCLQPWLFIFGRSGVVQLSTWSLAQFVALGGVSGAVFAVVVLMPLARWQGITTALTIVLFVIALACGVYATLNFNTLNNLRNRADPYGASNHNGQNKTDAGNL
jgi:apolipoprotein N-acyltransferase